MSSLASEPILCRNAPRQLMLKMLPRASAILQLPCSQRAAKAQPSLNALHLLQLEPACTAEWERKWTSSNALALSDMNGLDFICGCAQRRHGGRAHAPNLTLQRLQRLH